MIPMPLRWLLSLFAGAALTATFLLATDVPLGVPGEWTWKRTDFVGVERDAMLGAAAAVIVIAVYGTLLFFGRKAIERNSPWNTAAWLTALTLAAVAVLFAIESTTPGDYPTAKHAWVLYDRGSSGYFFEAAHGEQSTGEFLRGYEAKMAEGDVLHIGTHPPGLILLHRGLVAVCRASPALTSAVLATQPESIDSAFVQLEKTADLSPRPPPDSDRAALWLAVLLTHLVAAATVVPLFFVMRQDFGPRTAWSVATFWPLVPALAVFLPKSDALLPCVGMLFLWSWRSALRNRSFAAAAVAGGVIFGGLLLSLALLPVALFAGLLTAFETFANDSDRVGANRPPIVRNLLLAAVAIATFVAAVAAFSWLTEANLSRIWEWNYRNHAAFYAQPAFPRTWWKWLPVNAAEFVLAVGWPLALLAGIAVWRGVKPSGGWRRRCTRAGLVRRLRGRRSVAVFEKHGRSRAAVAVPVPVGVVDVGEVLA